MKKAALHTVGPILMAMLTLVAWQTSSSPEPEPEPVITYAPPSALGLAYWEPPTFPTPFPTEVTHRID